MGALQKVGGVAALIAAATFVVGLVMFATVLIDYTTADDPRDAVAFLVDNQVPLYVWNLLITIVFGVALAPLVLALHERVKGTSLVLARTATVFGLVWSGLIIATGMIVNIGFGTVVDLNESDPEMAATVWSAVDSVANGLGGGNELVGGLWLLLVSVAALKAGWLPRGLNWFGALIGVAGLVTVVPQLELVGAIFGLGLIVWFVWTGLLMVRSESRATAGSRELETASTA